MACGFDGCGAVHVSVWPKPSSSATSNEVDLQYFFDRSSYRLHCYNHTRTETRRSNLLKLINKKSQKIRHSRHAEYRLHSHGKPAAVPSEGAVIGIAGMQAELPNSLSAQRQTATIPVPCLQWAERFDCHPLGPAQLCGSHRWYKIRLRGRAGSSHDNRRGRESSDHLIVGGPEIGVRIGSNFLQTKLTPRSNQAQYRRTRGMDVYVELPSWILHHVVCVDGTKGRMRAPRKRRLPQILPQHRLLHQLLMVFVSLLGQG